jgi:hypothetical protein
MLVWNKDKYVIRTDTIGKMYMPDHNRAERRKAGRKSWQRLNDIVEELLYDVRQAGGRFPSPQRRSYKYLSGYYSGLKQYAWRLVNGS